ncbi:MAG: glycosyltransferase family 4 protein [Thermofilaceae archaeon]
MPWSATGRELSIAYVTGFNPFSYRRPLFAKKAIPFLKVYASPDALKRVKALYPIVVSPVFKLAKVESIFSKRSRSGGDYYITALLHDALNSTYLGSVAADAVIALNPYLGSKRIWDDHAVIIDWMDVWMWPWDEINPLDIRAVEEAEGVIFWSRPMMEVISRRIKIRRSVYVPHGIDFSSFNPSKFGKPDYFKRKNSLNGRFIFFYSGGLWRVEGIDLQGTDKMLKAFAYANNKVQKAVLVLQISRIDTQTYRLIHKLKVHGKIKLIGALPYASFERQSAFAAADVLLAPTSRHPVAYYAERIKLFQYMAASKAIIAERSPGALSALGGSALYVNLDDVEGLADSMVELYFNKELRGELSVRARERAKLFEWEKLAPVYRDFVLSTVNR